MREYGPVGKSFAGDTSAAKTRIGIARTQLGIMKNMMALGGLQQLVRNVKLADGTLIRVQSIFGQDRISITVPPGAAAGEGAAGEMVSVVNTAVDYVGVAMPNPVPYRGVSIGVLTVGGATSTYVMASDSTVLVSEVQTTSGGHTYYVPDPAWNGEGYANMYVDSVSPANLNHQLTFTVPEDCIYPTPSVTSSIFNTRKKGWFKKNSDELIAALKTGFAANAPNVTRAELKTGSLPASWDYQIKKNYNKDYDKGAYKLSDNSFAGHHTKMPIVMNITSAPDVIVSDTSANLTQAGTKVTRRTTTFTYTDAAGQAWSVPIDGTLTQVVTIHQALHDAVGMVTAAQAISVGNTYAQWFVLSAPEGHEELLLHPFLQDRTPNGVGLLWSGIVTTFPAINGRSATGATIVVHPTRYTDSKWGSPAELLNITSEDLAGVTFDIPLPWYSNTLISTAPDIFLQYHNTVLPQYVTDTAQSSTAMNNSAMYHTTHVELVPFGLVTSESLGVFPDANEDGTRVEIYGKAIYKFDWSTGALTFQGWNPMRDPNGNIASKTITIPGNYSDAGYNCLVGYVWDSPDQMWPDVEEYLRKKVTAVAATDPILYTLIKEAVAL